MADQRLLALCQLGYLRLLPQAQVSLLFISQRARSGANEQSGILRNRP